MELAYYLGANTPQGFHCCFPSMTDAVSRLYIIKGGPGTGKSTAMRRIADACEAAGADVERIWCASDGNSLDGVYIPLLDTLYVDGTSPHVVEPTCPGARDGILDFGACWDEAMLASRREEIEALQQAIAACYARLYHYLRAVGALAALRREAAQACADLVRLNRRTRRIVQQHIPPHRGAAPGRCVDMFLNTLTPDGPTFRDSFRDFTVCELADEAGLYPLVTAQVRDAALSAGYVVYAAHDPLFPDEAPLHVIVPELRFALLTAGGVFGCDPVGRRRIRLDKMTEYREDKSTVLGRKRDESCCSALLQGAQTALGDAKCLHDALEAVYRPAVDFTQIDVLTARHCAMLEEEIRRRTRDSRSL